MNLDSKMSVASDPYRTSTSNSDTLVDYRVMSIPAVATVVVSVLSTPSLVFPGLLFLPLIGVAVGLVALRKIGRNSAEYSGRGIALGGLIANIMCFAGGVSIATTIYVTEVPANHQRISFSELQPDKRRSDLPVSERALELDGERVFIKGYIYPSDANRELKQFILVPDRGTCCFGGQPKLTDMIEVTLRDPLTTRYSMMRRKLGGILHVSSDKKPVSGLDGVYYQLDADHLR